jgi:hypothetical protein
LIRGGAAAAIGRAQIVRLGGMEPPMFNAVRHVNPSRRRLLRRAGLAGLAASALAAEQLARPAGARAANGDPLTVGQANTGTLTTTLTNTGTGDGFDVTASNAGAFAISGANHTTGANGYGVLGYSLNNAVGVYGYSVNNWGVAAHSTNTTALQSQSINGVGIVGVSNVVTAIYGQSGGTNGYAETKDAIRGFTDSAAGSGVRGENVNGGTGVTGIATSKAKGGGGTGVHAAASGVGTALRVDGRAVFSRSGDVVIKSPSSSATVTVPGGLSASALVLALLQTANPGVFVTSAVPNAATGKVTIHLNKAPGTGKAGGTAKVAWFVVG